MLVFQWQVVILALVQRLLLLQMMDRIPVPYPPDPGDANQSTLTGIDSNNNGVRDDVERAVFSLHDSSFENRQIIMAGAVALQDSLVSSTTDSDHDNDLASEAVMSFMYCLTQHTTLDTQKQLALLRSLVINSPVRLEAYEAYNVSRNGTIQRVVTPTLDECVSLVQSEGS